MAAAADTSGGRTPGRISVEDLAGYRTQMRDPLCADYRGKEICGMPPPSSGPLTVLMILGLGERLGLQHQDPASAAWAHLFAEASRVAFADRDRYMADPDFVPQPVARHCFDSPPFIHLHLK